MIISLRLIVQTFAVFSAPISINRPLKSVIIICAKEFLPPLFLQLPGNRRRRYFHSAIFGLLLGPIVRNIFFQWYLAWLRPSNDAISEIFLFLLLTVSASADRTMRKELDGRNNHLLRMHFLRGPSSSAGRCLMRLAATDRNHRAIFLRNHQLNKLARS